MRILFVTDHKYLPDRTGGAEQGTHALCVELQRRGIAVAVLAATETDDPADWRGPKRKNVGHWGYRDDVMGYPVHRRRNPAEPASVAEIVRDFVPSVAVIQPSLYFPLARACLAVDVPAVVYFRDVQFDDMYGMGVPPGTIDPKNPLMTYLANSRFVAERVAKVIGVAAYVIPSLIRPEAYRTETSRRKALFVNPVPKKGVDIALRLAAARPDIPFEVIESWPLSAAEFEDLGERCRKLGNVNLHRAVADMREIYAEARLMLVPSRWEESWGRVVTEAQASGIPVLASRIGGLPESVGPGGVLVDPDGDFGAWVAALSLLWDNEAAYTAYADAARAHSRRPEIAPAQILDRFLAVLGRHEAKIAPAAGAPRMGDIGLCVIVPTHRRPADLDWLLGRLRPQITDHPNRRVIVVNDGSDDARYRAVIERHRDIADYLVLPENHGPATARNAGAARAGEDWLVFIDDDCEPPPYWLDWLCATIAENPDADAVGGTTRPLPSRLPGPFERFLGEAGFHPQPLVIDGRPLLFVSANLAVRRTAFALIGGFDESMITTEDRNLTYRLGRNQVVLHLDPGWFVYHDMAVSPLVHFRRYYHYGVDNRRELEFEASPPDRRTWPAATRPLFYWFGRAAHSLRRMRASRDFRWRAPPARWLCLALGALTYLVMDWGFARGPVD